LGVSHKTLYFGSLPSLTTGPDFCNDGRDSGPDPGDDDDDCHTFNPTRDHATHASSVTSDQSHQHIRVPTSRTRDQSDADDDVDDWTHPATGCHAGPNLQVEDNNDGCDSGPDFYDDGLDAGPDAGDDKSQADDDDDGCDSGPDPGDGTNDGHSKHGTHAFSGTSDQSHTR
jgi:hypothetical protein